MVLQDFICGKLEYEMTPDEIAHLSFGSQKKAETFFLKELGKKAAEIAEKEAIQEVLQKTCCNRKETAKLLYISFRALLYKIQKYQLNEWRGLKKVEYRTC
jgi:DNA-binding NtrC family response regulator